MQPFGQHQAQAAVEHIEELSRRALCKVHLAQDNGRNAATNCNLPIYIISALQAVSCLLSCSWNNRTGCNQVGPGHSSKLAGTIQRRRPGTVLVNNYTQIHFAAVGPASCAGAHEMLSEDCQRHALLAGAQKRIRFS